MIRPFKIDNSNWNSVGPTTMRHAALNALESGLVLFFPNLKFEVRPEELRFLDPTILASSKNVSYRPADDSIRGSVCVGREAEELRALLRRFATTAREFMGAWLSDYGNNLRQERASLRPARVEGRQTSWRKDDTRLHVDSFPSQPTGGRRILRLFCNVNPTGRPRTWRIGEPFELVAKRFWPRLTPPGRIDRQILSLLRVTKGYRSDYDHYMLQLHDAMKRDEEYQQEADDEVIDFPAGSAWACFADQVSHAVIAGQHQFEQTFSLPVEAMATPENSPLRVLERLAGRGLVEARKARAA